MKNAIQPISKEEIKALFLSRQKVIEYSSKIEEKSAGGFCQFFWVDYQDISLSGRDINKILNAGLKIIGIYPQKKENLRLVLEMEDLSECIGVQEELLQ